MSRLDSTLLAGRQTFDSVYLYDMLVDRVLEIRVLPRNENLPSGDPLQSNLWSGRNVQSQFVYEDLIWSLTDLIGTVQKPESQISTSEQGRSESAWRLTISVPTELWPQERGP